MEVFSRALDALGKAGALVGKRKGGLGTGCEACVLETSCGALWYLSETDRRRCWGWPQGLSCPVGPGSCLSPSLDLCELPWERDAAPSGGRRLKATCAHPSCLRQYADRPGDRCHGRWGLRGSCLRRKERAYYQAIFVGGWEPSPSPAPPGRGGLVLLPPAQRHSPVCTQEALTRLCGELGSQICCLDSDALQMRVLGPFTRRTRQWVQGDAGAVEALESHLRGGLLIVYRGPGTVPFM